MEYKLAKKLKDAGFPQENGLWGYADIPENRTHNPQGRTFIRKAEIRLFPWHRRGGFNKAAYPVVMCPTLSELIAACPTYLFDQEFNLHATHEEGRVEWCACYISPLNLNGSAKHLSLGETPEIAVANLWLALNEKNP